jgi:hypothetical protein
VSVYVIFVCHFRVAPTQLVCDREPEQVAERLATPTQDIRGRASIHRVCTQQGWQHGGSDHH